MLNCSMTELFRMRVEPETLAKAEQVTNSLGTTPAAMVRVFLTEIANTGRIPVTLNRPSRAASSTFASTGIVCRRSTTPMTLCRGARMSSRVAVSFMGCFLFEF